MTVGIISVVLFMILFGLSSEIYSQKSEESFIFKPWETTSMRNLNVNFYNAVDFANSYIKRQLNSAENSIKGLETQTSDVVNWSNIFLKIMVLEGEHMVKSYFKSIMNDVHSGAISKYCVEITAITRMAEAISPIVEKCSTKATIKTSNIMQKTRFNMEELNSEIKSLSKITNRCFDEPGVGEKINCILAKINEIQPIAREMISTVGSTVRRLTTDFTENMQFSSDCINEAANQVIKSINSTIERTRNCPKSQRSS